MKILVIDVFNLLYKFPDLYYFMEKDEFESAKEGILNILDEFSQKNQQDEFYLFLDGKKQRGDETLQEERGKMKLLMHW